MHKINRNIIEDLHMQHVKLATLCILEQSAGYCANMDLLKDILKEFGLIIASEKYSEVLKALANTALISIQNSHPCTPVMLTNKGIDVANGTIKVEDILKPGPENPYKFDRSNFISS